jgi:pimeloyl-ACP methyl ester carboxylesterase
MKTLIRPLPTSLFFLPGAGGSAAFWHPVAERLGTERRMRFFSWPGLGDEPADPAVASLDDLAALVLAALDRPADLVAQSMGGVVAVKAALAAPDKVRRLVLTATSAGVPMTGAQDWRPIYREAFPNGADWVGDPQPDLSARIATLDMPTLLLWGDRDPISPVSVGETLLSLLPQAELRVIQGGGHDLAVTHADQVAPLIADHLLGA